MNLPTNEAKTKKIGTEQVLTITLRYPNMASLLAVIRSPSRLNRSSIGQKLFSNE